MLDCSLEIERDTMNSRVIATGIVVLFAALCVAVAMRHEWEPYISIGVGLTVCAAFGYEMGRKEKPKTNEAT